MNKSKLSIPERRNRNNKRKNRKKREKWNNILVAVFSVLIKHNYLSQQHLNINILNKLFLKSNTLDLKSDLEYLIDKLVIRYDCKLKSELHLNVLNMDQMNALLTDGFVYIDNFIEKDLILKILYEVDHNKNIIWRHPNNHGRDDIITWLRPSDDVCYSKADSNGIESDNNPFYTLLNRYILKLLHGDLIHFFNLKSNKGHFEHQLASYVSGSNGYAIHRDCNKIESTNLNGRKLTCIVYLQDESYNAKKDGGQLLIYKDERPIETTSVKKINPKGGRLVIFFSGAIEHVVLPFGAKKDKKRVAFTTWFS